MLIDLVPNDLKVQFEQCLQQLQQLEHKAMNKCPYCESDKFRQARSMPLTFRCKLCRKYFNPLSKTPFNRLQPIALIPAIFSQRVERISYLNIAFNLDLTLRQIQHRERAIKLYLQQYFPELFVWYSQDDKQSTASKTVKQQQQRCIDKIKGFLECEHVNCQYCDSNKTVRIGHRAGFRCHNCTKTFNLLSGTLLNKMPYADKWIDFINLLAAHKTDSEIAKTLQLNPGTVGKWRRYWCAMMQQWQFEALSVWCRKK